MRLFHACSLLIASSMLLVACGAPSQGPAADAGPTATAQPIATLSPTAAPEPTQTVPAPTEPPVQSKGTITFAFDAFATYYPGIIVDTRGLLKKRGYDLALVPFGFDGMNDLNEGQRWAKL